MKKLLFSVLILFLIIFKLFSGEATFFKQDISTQGNWKTAYGKEGFAICNDVINYPTYSSVILQNTSTFTWQDPSNDIRSLEKANSTERLASLWYSSTSSIIDINLTDSLYHQLAIYFLDWDQHEGGRNQSVEILDVDNNDSILYSSTLSNFNNGTYLVWKIKGHIKIRIINLNSATSSSCFNGIFFDKWGPVLALTWNHNSPEENISHYNVYRNNVFIDSVLLDLTNPPIYFLTRNSGVNIYYVTAVNIIGESGPSNLVTIPENNDVPQKPSGLRLVITE